MKTRGKSREILFRLGTLAALPLLVASCGGGGGGGAKTVIVQKCDREIECTLKYEPELTGGNKTLLFELSIPKGALEESAEISIEQSDGPDKSLSFMPTYRILPETLKFATGKKAGLVLGYVYDKDDKDNPLPNNLEEGGLRIGKRNSAGGFDLQKDSGPPRLDVDQISGEVTSPGEYAVVYNPIIFSVTPEVGNAPHEGKEDGTPITVTGVNFKTDFQSAEVVFNKVPVPNPDTNIKFAENKGNTEFTVTVPELPKGMKEEDLKGALTIVVISSTGKKRTSNAVTWGFGSGFDAAVYDLSVKWGRSAVLDKCTDPDCFVQPWGIAIDQFDCIYVADAGSHQLKKFTPSGGLAGTSASCPAFKGDVSQVGKPGKGDQTKTGEESEFNTPRGVAVDASGNIYVADSLNHRVVMLDKTGMFVKAYGTRGTGANEKGDAVEGQLDQPAGLTLDPAGDVIVVDSLNNRIVKFNPLADKPTEAAKQSAIIGPPLSDALGALKMAQEPAGIALDKASSPARLYVVDPGNWRIVYFDRKETKDEKGVISATYEVKGAFGQQAKSGEGKDEKFVRPTGVTVDVRGTVYVVDNQGPRIQKFDKTLNALPTEVGNPKDRTQIGEPTTAVVDSKAGIFVVDRTLSKVQKFAPR